MIRDIYDAELELFRYYLFDKKELKKAIENKKILEDIKDIAGSRQNNNVAEIKLFVTDLKNYKYIVQEINDAPIGKKPFAFLGLLGRAKYLSNMKLLEEAISNIKSKLDNKGE